MKSMKDMWLEAPEGQLEPALKELIRKWDDSPKAIQILEVLDQVIYTGGGTGFVVTSLQIMYDMACKAENTTHEEVVKGATWR